MNCQDFEKIVIALAHNRLPDAATFEPSLRHTDACVRCAMRLGEERTLTIGMRAVAAEVALQEAPESLEAALLSAFREHTTAVISSTVIAMPCRKRHGTGRKRTAIAAGVLLLIAVLASLWLQPDGSNWQRKERATSSAAPPAAPESPAPSSMLKEPESKQQVAQHTASTRSDKRQRYQKYRGSLNETEVVTEFFPLLEGDDLNSLESGQIVRVELSGSALLAVGLPVDAEMASEAIKADVVLGHDGQARAIRFVR